MKKQQESGLDRIIKPEIEYINIEEISDILENTITNLQYNAPLDLFETIQTKEMPGNGDTLLNSIQTNLFTEILPEENRYNIGLFTILYSNIEKNVMRNIIGGRETGHFSIDEEEKYVNFLHGDEEAITPDIRSEEANTKENLAKRLMNYQKKINQGIDELYETVTHTEEGLRNSVEIDLSEAYKALNSYVTIKF